MLCAFDLNIVALTNIFHKEQIDVHANDEIKGVTLLGEAVLLLFV
jgi:hypothetical protein